MSGIDTGSHKGLSSQTPESGTRFAGQDRQAKPQASLQKRAADFEPRLKAAEQGMPRGTPALRKTEEEPVDFAPLQPAPLAPQARADVAMPQTARDQPAAGAERLATTLSEIATRSPAPGVTLEAGSGLRIPLDVPFLGARAATITLTAGEILVILHGAPGLAPPDAGIIAEAARNLSLSLFHRLPERRLNLTFEEDRLDQGDGSDTTPRFNPLLGPVR